MQLGLRCISVAESRGLVAEVVVVVAVAEELVQKIAVADAVVDAVAEDGVDVEEGQVDTFHDVPRLQGKQRQPHCQDDLGIDCE